MRFSNSLNTLVAILAASVVGALAASIESPTPGTILFDGENFDFKFQGTPPSVNGAVTDGILVTIGGSSILSTGTFLEKIKPTNVTTGLYETAIKLEPNDFAEGCGIVLAVWEFVKIPDPFSLAGFATIYNAFMVSNLGITHRNSSFPIGPC